MTKKEVLINNQSGLESKSVALLIQKASSFKSGIFIEKGEKKANAKSLLGLLSLGIGDGAKVTIIADGEDEEKAITELEEYLKSDSLTVK